MSRTPMIAAAQDCNPDLRPSLGHRLFLVLVLLWSMMVALSAGGTSRAADAPASASRARSQEEQAPAELPLSRVAYHSARRSAPELKVAAWVDQSGPVTPPHLQGKVQLVVFWGVNCPACMQKIPKVREAAARFAGTDLVVIGLHNAQISPDRAARFARDRGLNYPIAIDRTGSNRYSFGMTTDAYRVQTIPHAAVVDRDGTLRFVGQFEQALQAAEALLKVTSGEARPRFSRDADPA